MRVTVCIVSVLSLSVGHVYVLGRALVRASCEDALA
jgi:hypothetical protein